MVAAAVVGAAAIGVAGGAMASSGAKSAGESQASAARDAAGLQNEQWQQTQANLKPYLNLGQQAMNPLIHAMGYYGQTGADGQYSLARDPSNPLQQTFSAPTAGQAQETPGYQFTRDQGLQAVQNSAAARGLGTSGAAMKGAAGYATGLADSTYNDVYSRALSTYNTNYSSAANNANRLQGLVSNGQNAAATNGSLGASTAGNISNTLMSGANASAAGTIGSANALASGMSGAGNSAMMYGLMQNNAAKTPAAGAQQSWAPSSSDAAI